MSAINILRMTERRAAYRWIGAAALRAATAVWTCLQQAKRAGECEWSRLNSHWLADIGETREAARLSAQRDAPGGPFGFIGDRVEADRLRLYAYWRSPLG